MTAQASHGYRFRGSRAELIERRLKFIRQNPKAAAAIFSGKRPKGYPSADIMGAEVITRNATEISGELDSYPSDDGGQAL